MECLCGGGRACPCQAPRQCTARDVVHASVHLYSVHAQCVCMCMSLLRKVERSRGTARLTSRTTSCASAQLRLLVDRERARCHLVPNGGRGAAKGGQTCGQQARHEHVPRLHRHGHRRRQPRRQRRRRRRAPPVHELRVLVRHVHASSDLQYHGLFGGQPLLRGQGVQHRLKAAVLHRLPPERCSTAVRPVAPLSAVNEQNGRVDTDDAKGPRCVRAPPARAPSETRAVLLSLLACACRIALSVCVSRRASTYHLWQVPPPRQAPKWACLPSRPPPPPAALLPLLQHRPPYPSVRARPGVSDGVEEHGASAPA